jgi:hypothetical protein
MVFSSFLEYWTMDEVQKPSNPEVNICHTSHIQNVLEQGEVLLPLFSTLI